MSANANVQLAKVLYTALATGDRTGLTELLHPDFVGHTTEGLPNALGGDYEGPESMRRKFWGRLGKAFDAAAEPSDFQSLEDGRLLVHGRYVGTGRESGATLDAEFMHVLRFESGRIIELRQLTDSQRWVEAAQPRAIEKEPPPLQFQIDAGIATIQLDRPHVHNAIDADMATALYEAAKRCAGDPSLRVLLITGTGRSFTVGGDVGFLTKCAPEALPGLLRSMTSPYHEALRIFSRLNAPIVAAVQGAAAGGGLGLLYSADIVIAAENLKIATGFAALGLSMDGGNSWFLPRLVGSRRAAELYFEERVLSAAEALDWGLVTRVVPLADLAEAASACATRLSKGPTRAYGEVRRLFRDSLNATLSEQLGSETDALARTAATADASMALSSFIAKKKPQFEGR